VTDNPTISEIKAVVLFGSHARGDASCESDLDICVITKAQRMVTVDEISPYLPMPDTTHLSLSTYGEADVNAMLEYGSLFLWHLRLEGLIVYGEEYLLPQLASLRQFEKHHDEIVYHQQIFNDLVAVANGQGNCNEFDLALLFTIVRNTCMVLAHKAGTPTFGRKSCYCAAAREYSNLSLDESTYLMLSQWKMVYERGIDTVVKLPTFSEMQRLLKIVQDLLEHADAQTR